MTKAWAIAVSVPIEDGVELTELATAFEEAPPVESHGLDGSATATLVASGLHVAALALLRAWLVARVERHKESTVSVDGRVFHGYSVEEVDRLIAVLERHAAGGRDEPGAGSDGPLSDDRA